MTPEMLEEKYITFRDTCRKGYPWLSISNGDAHGVELFAKLTCEASFGFAPGYTTGDIASLAEKHNGEPEIAYFAKAFNDELQGI
jgi:hypothetical protein